MPLLERNEMTKAEGPACPIEACGLTPEYSVLGGPEGETGVLCCASHVGSVTRAMVETMGVAHVGKLGNAEKEE